MSDPFMGAEPSHVQNSSGYQSGNTPAAITRRFNNVAIGQRLDGYLNATAMCKANGREWSGYERNGGTEEFIQELSQSLQICRDSLIVSKPGRPDRGGGTWVHPRIGYHLALWCSAKFAVKVTEWVEEIDTKGYAVAPGVTTAPILPLARSHQTPNGLFRDYVRSYKIAGFSVSEAALAANRAVVAQTGMDILGAGGVVLSDAAALPALPSPDHPEFLGPSEIGLEIGIRTDQPKLSGRLVNTLLATHGFQTKGATTTTPWHATAKGEPFAKWETAEKAGEHGGTVNVLRWNFSIVAELLAVMSSDTTQH